MQGAAQEDIAVVRIHASRGEEVKAGEVHLGTGDCVLVSDPTNDFCEDLGALSTDLMPGGEIVVQLGVDSVSCCRAI